MRRHNTSNWRRSFIVLGLTTVSLLGYSQDRNSSPATDSIQISNIHADGNSANGQVEVSMDFTNHYYRPVLIHLILGGYEGLGLTDNKGNKYKIPTSDQLYNTSDINKGFIGISAVQFGDKSFKSFTYVDQKVPPGESRQLLIRIPKVSQSITEFNELSTHRQVSINYGLVGDHVIKLQDIRILWSGHITKAQ